MNGDWTLFWDFSIRDFCFIGPNQPNQHFEIGFFQRLIDFTKTHRHSA